MLYVRLTIKAAELDRWWLSILELGDILEIFWRYFRDILEIF